MTLAVRPPGAVESERDFYRRLLDLGGQQELGPLLEDALALAVEVTGARIAYLELHDDEDDGAPRFWRARGLDAAGVDAVRAQVSRGIIARAMSEGEIVETPSASADDRFADLGSVRTNAIQAVLCVPIGQPPLGVLYIQGRTVAGAFSATDRERMQLFARQLAPLADRLLAQRPERVQVDHTKDARARFHAPELVGRSPALAHVLQQAALVAPLDVDVLITGPSGTGKSVLARAIAANSKRAAAPFVALNCAALPDPLFESELFGAERGAHSTAMKRTPGKVAAAEGGTLFLDEIGELSLGAQAKLLHLLQAREYHALGATTASKANVRIIAATNADLKARVTAKTFREDLYYRLSVLPIALPGLAERRDDAPVIAEHLCGEICQRHGFAPLTLARRALQACRDAAWPGNVRELAHALEAAVIRANGAGSDLVLEQHLFPAAAPAAGDPRRPDDLPRGDASLPAPLHPGMPGSQRLERRRDGAAARCRQITLVQPHEF
jgi:transcriptional regulator with GAF, ATPase, and Fis domain